MLVIALALNTGERRILSSEFVSNCGLGTSFVSPMTRIISNRTAFLSSVVTLLYSTCDDLFFCIVVEARTGLSFVAIPLTQALALLLVLLCVVACVVARPCYLQMIVEDIFILSKKSHYITCSKLSEGIM